jgi:hypothetical protein
VWAGDAFAVKVNGVVVQQPTLATLRGGSAGGRGNSAGNEGESHQTSSYVELKRTWRTGDTIELSLTKSLRLEPTPDNKSVAAILWGPLVLAGDMGPRREGRGATPAPTPVLVTAGRPVSEWVQPNPLRSGDFNANQVARLTSSPEAAPTDVTLKPFYRTHRRSYSVYFDVLSAAEFEARAGKD